MAKKEDGFVYIFSNPSLNCLKIGNTRREPQDRAIQMSRSDAIPTPFKVEFAINVKGGRYQAEQKIHKLLEPYRIGKEFFKISVEDAKTILIKNIKGETLDEFITQRLHKMAGDINRVFSVARL